MASTSINTTLQVSAITIPVGMRKIKQSQDVKIERATLDGNKAVQRLFDAQVAEDDANITAENVLTDEDFQYGVFESEGVFKPISADAIKEIEEATKLDTFAVEEFIPVSAIPWERATDTYFLAPQRGKGGAASAKAMALLNRAMRKAKKAGVMKICLTKRQYLAVVYAKGDALFVTLLAWAEDWAQADEANVLAGVAVDAAQVDMAVTLIEALATDDAQTALDSKVDDLRVEKAALVEAAKAGKPVKAKAKKVASEDPSGLEALLAASLAATQA